MLVYFLLKAVEDFILKLTDLILFYYFSMSIWIWFTFA